MEAVLGIQRKRSVQDLAPGPWRRHAVRKLHGDGGQPPRLPSGGRVAPLRHTPSAIDTLPTPDHRHAARPCHGHAIPGIQTNVWLTG
jgi:hypothetical protein